MNGIAWMLFFTLLATPMSELLAMEIPESSRSTRAADRVSASLSKELSRLGLEYGAPVFIRIFKQPGELELWLENSNKNFKLFKTYKICHFSGKPGPKRKTGDRQSPEGFYFVKGNQLNPWSRFHLSFNLGYPNAYDRAHGRTGSALMVHGNCVSIGCYAMTDAFIEEIYTLVDAALRRGQIFFRVHIFPFPLSEGSLDKLNNHQWYSFWRNLQSGYLHFEKYGRPPNVTVKNKLYHFDES